MIKYSRFQVWLVQLNPTQGREINKTRPCVVLSPNEMHKLSTVLVAPMTTKGFAFPSRVACDFDNKTGLILLDQIRAIDQSRMLKCVGEIDAKTQHEVCHQLQSLFAF